MLPERIWIYVTEILNDYVYAGGAKLLLIGAKNLQLFIEEMIWGCDFSYWDN